MKIKEKKLWYADKKLGTCYQTECTLYYAEDAVKDETRYWIKPLNTQCSDIVELGRGLFTKRELAYSYLICELCKEIEECTKKISRANSERIK